VVKSPASGFNVNKLNVRGVECEFSFKMKEDLKPKKDGSLFTEEDVAQAVDCVVPSIEICGSRFQGDIPLSIRIADGGGEMEYSLSSITLLFLEL
jgi:2-keto-4-pentenoate hydratase